MTTTYKPACNKMLQPPQVQSVFAGGLLFFDRRGHYGLSDTRTERYEAIAKELHCSLATVQRWR